MVPILLMTDTFRGNTAVSRWHDPVWLGWFAVPLYWVHQFEEYSLPVIGLDYSLPDMVCKDFGFEPYPTCPIPMPFYPLVNIALMGFGAPLAAYLGRCQLTSWNEKIGFLVGLDINSETNGRSIVSLLVPVPSAALSGIASSTLEIGSQRCAAIVSKEMSKAPHILHLNAHSQIRCSKLNA